MELLKPKTTEKIKAKEVAEVQAVAEKAKVKKAIKIAKVEASADTKAAIKRGAERKQVLQGLLATKVLQVSGADYFLYGYPSVKMPELLVDRFVDYVILKRDAQPLINFWMWCLLNPNKIARYKLFAYLSKHRLLLTPSGYIVTYRMVKETTTSKEDGVYVDAHTGQFQHTIGKVSKMKRSACDEDGKNDCSRGLHTGSPDFIGISLGDGYNQRVIKTKKQGGGYGTGYGYRDEVVEQKFNNTFGNQAVICLVNPMHVVSVPNSDTRKMRSCELYIAKTTTPEEVLSHLTEVDYLVFDNDYAQIEAAEIEAQLKNAKLEDYTDGSVEQLLGQKTSPAKKRLLELQNRLTSLSTSVMEEKIPDDVTPEEMMKVIQSRVHQVSSRPAPQAKVVSMVDAIVKRKKIEKVIKPKEVTPKVEETKVKDIKKVSSSKDVVAPKKEAKPIKVAKEAKDLLLKAFVVEQWEKIKKAKKSPKNFMVVNPTSGLIIVKGTKEDVIGSGLNPNHILGNLDELYNKYK